MMMLRLSLQRKEVNFNDHEVVSVGLGVPKSLSASFAIWYLMSDRRSCLTTK